MASATLPFPAWYSISGHLRGTFGRVVEKCIGDNFPTVVRAGGEGEMTCFGREHPYYRIISDFWYALVKGNTRCCRRGSRQYYCSATRTTLQMLC